ncbi:MAG: hypothetical protein KGI33_01490 [Thaumarchaeota archaeon]|nr:hypothetical protein [Nitrososphaerota archaeon]
MDEGKATSFRNILTFQSSLKKDMDELKKRSDDYARIIGEKLRSNEGSSESDLNDLRSKITDATDPKKRKTVKKKELKGNWHDLDGMFVYDGIGLKGELEIYFKALEDTKLRMEKIEKIKASIDDLVSKGVRKDLSCTAFLGRDLVLDVAFMKSASTPTRFSHKSTFRVEAEPIQEIAA